MGKLSRREKLTAALGLLAAVVVLSSGAYGMAVGANAREQDVARSSLSNCQQIEVIKSEIRGTVQASVERIPTLDYYRRRPAELRQAVRDAQASVRRFAPKDCYDLPAVRAAGIRRPR